jgi:hypothetical protein
VFYYPNFNSPRDTLKVASEVKHSVTRETGYQALMRVRCSNGLQVSAYHGNFVQHTFGAELELGTIDADKAFGIMFSYDGKLDPNLDAHFQSAVLYTTAAGQRRVRCSNIVASVSEGGREAMRYVDQDAVVHLMAKEGAYAGVYRFSLLLLFLFGCSHRHDYASPALTEIGLCSRIPRDRAKPQGNPGRVDREDNRHSGCLPPQHLRLVSSRPAGAARISQRVQHVRLGPNKIARLQRYETEIVRSTEQLWL